MPRLSEREQKKSSPTGDRTRGFRLKVKRDYHYTTGDYNVVTIRRIVKVIKT